MADKKKEKNRVKGFIILCVIFVICFGLTIYLCKLYNVYDEYKKETPVISGVLSEINNDDFEHYILENPSSVIYMCTSKEDSCRNFEKDFKKFIKNKELANQIIYLNLSGLDQEQFILSFNEKYKFKNKLTSNYPAFVVFEDGKVVGLLQGKDNKNISISKVKHFLELNNIGEGE